MIVHLAVDYYAAVVYHIVVQEEEKEEEKTKDEDAHKYVTNKTKAGEPTDNASSSSAPAFPRFSIEDLFDKPTLRPLLEGEGTFGDELVAHGFEEAEDEEEEEEGDAKGKNKEAKEERRAQKRREFAQEMRKRG